MRTEAFVRAPLKVGRLIELLEEMDPDAPVVVNICGHAMNIAYVQGEVHVAEILLVDEHSRPCAMPAVLNEDLPA